MEYLKKLNGIIKTILFVAAMILTYLISERFVDFILTVDPIILKRVLNIILVVIVMICSNNSKK
jgi:uncharacterized membrane protein YdcZ (DUF606 family)